MASSRFKKLKKRLPARRDVLLVLLGAVITLFCFETVNFIHSQQVPLKPQAATADIHWLPVTVQRWQTPIDEMAKKYNVDPDLISIIMTMESGGYANAKSEDDAQGLMQITPPTAQDIAAKFLKKPVTSYNLYDPRTNIEFGAAYLAYLRDQFGTAAQGPSWDYTVELVAAGYNGGPGAANRVEQGKGLIDTQTVIYSRDAFNMWRERHASDSPTFDRWKERGGIDLINAAASSVSAVKN